MLGKMSSDRGEISFEDIMTLFRQENKSSQLTKVDPQLYGKTEAHIKTLRKERERAAAVNPMSATSMMLRDQLKKAIDKSKRVYELRQRKIALMALRKVAGDNPDTANLTPDELVLFSSLVSVAGAHKDVHADFEGLGPQFTTPRDVVELPKAPDRKTCEAKREAKAEEQKPEDELVMVRVLEDMPAFAGVDRDYKLKKEDIVSLPSSIAKTLVSHGKIKVIESP